MKRIMTRTMVIYYVHCTSFYYDRAVFIQTDFRVEKRDHLVNIQCRHPVSIESRPLVLLLCTSFAGR